MKAKQMMTGKVHLAYSARDIRDNRTYFAAQCGAVRASTRYSLVEVSDDTPLNCTRCTKIEAKGQKS